MLFAILYRRIHLVSIQVGPYIRNSLKRGTTGTKDKNDCCLPEEAYQNSQSYFEQLIKVESDTAVNTAADAQLQHEKKSRHAVLNEDRFLKSRMKCQNQVKQQKCSRPLLTPLRLCQRRCE